MDVFAHTVEHLLHHGRSLLHRPLLMMFFLVQIFEEKKYSSPTRGAGSLAGLYMLGHQKERGTVKIV